MATDYTHCPSCAAPVDLTARSCPYCGVPYPKPRQASRAVAICGPGKPHKNIEALVRMVTDGLMTPNEARRRMGLADYEEEHDTSGLLEED